MATALFSCPRVCVCVFVCECVGVLCRHCLSLRYKTERQRKRAHKTETRKQWRQHRSASILGTLLAREPAEQFWRATETEREWVTERGWWTEKKRQSCFACVTAALFVFVLLSSCFAGSVFCFVSVLCVCLSVCVMSVCGEWVCVCRRFWFWFRYLLRFVIQC